MIQLLAALLLASSSAAAAAKLFVVPVEPELSLEPFSVAHERPINLRVVDSRRDKDVMRVAFNDRPVGIQNELADTYQAAIARGLRERGFVVLAGEQPKATTLTVQITELKYLFWPGGVGMGNEWLILSEVRGFTSDYQRTYAGSHILRYSAFKVNPSKEKAAAGINKAVGDGISKLLNDKNLMNALARD